MIILFLFFAQGLPPISAPLRSIDQNVPTTSRTRGDYNAKFLIQQSDKGRGILRTYNDTKFLPKDAKTAITQIVVDEFVDRYGKLTSQELKQRSEELFELFPTEPKVTLSGFQNTLIINPTIFNSFHGINRLTPRTIEESACNLENTHQDRFTSGTTTTNPSILGLTRVLKIHLEITLRRTKRLKLCLPPQQVRLY